MKTLKVSLVSLCAITIIVIIISTLFFHNPLETSWHYIFYMLFGTTLFTGNLLKTLKI
jgi:hypothetical protein